MFIIDKYGIKLRRFQVSSNSWDRIKKVVKYGMYDHTNSFVDISESYDLLKTTGDKLLLIYYIFHKLITFGHLISAQNYYVVKRPKEYDIHGVVVDWYTVLLLQGIEKHWIILRLLIQRLVLEAANFEIIKNPRKHFLQSKLFYFI